MPVTVEEQFGSVEWSDDTNVEVGFVIKGAADAADAYAELVSTVAGTSFNGLPYQDASVSEINENTGYWYGSARYGFERPPRRTGTKPQDGKKDSYVWETHLEERVETFRDGNGTHAWNTVAYYGPGGLFPSNPPAIPVALGYKGENRKHEGLTVLRPTSSFSLDYYPATSVVTDTYVRNVADAVGKVNSVVFNGFQIGEVMFSSARGSHTREDGWRFNYQFLVKLNRTDLAVAPNITVASAEGWNVIEVYYKPKPVQGSDGVWRKTEVAFQAVVWETHPKVDFNTVLFP